MGMLVISTAGSFGKSEKLFMASKHGHAHAVAEAIEYLGGTVLREAINNDHKCHNENVRPEKGFTKNHNDS